MMTRLIQILVVLLLAAPAWAQPSPVPVEEEGAPVEVEGDDPVPVAEEDPPTAETETTDALTPEEAPVGTNTTEEITADDPAVDAADPNAAQPVDDEETRRLQRLKEDEEKARLKEEHARQKAEEAKREGEILTLYNDYRALMDAYVSMSNDYEETIKQYLVGRLNDRIKQVESARDEQIDKLRVMESQRRTNAIAAFESFLRRYKRFRTDPQYREAIADAMFRLAQLHRDEAEFQAELDEDLYDQRMQEYEWGVRHTPPSAGEVDYRKTLDLYREVVKEFPEYRYRDMVMYLLGYFLRQEGKLPESITVLEEMAATYPKSEFALAGWMLIGHNSYDLDKYKDAIKAYERVTAVKENNSSYSDALYRLGWSCFQEFLYDRAIRTFLSLLEYVENNKSKLRQSGGLKKEAIESIASSFVDEDWDGDNFTDPDAGPGRALPYISQGKSYEKEVLRYYGDLLFDFKKTSYWQDAVTVYREYLRRFPTDEENPLVHDRIVYSLFELSRSPEVPPAERERYAMMAMEERARMATLYGKGSEWADIHRYNAKAIELAQSKLSTNLLERAQLLHQAAQESTDPVRSKTLYSQAAQAFEDYLEQFPKANDYVEMMRRLADIQLFGLKNFTRAAELFGTIRDLDRKGNTYRAESAVAAIDARAMVIGEVEAMNDPATPIPDKLLDLEANRGTTIAKVTLPDSQDPTARRTIIPVEIPGVVKLWMTEAQKYLDMEFDGEADQNFRGELAFLIGKIYLRYGQFEKAREQYNYVLDKYPTYELLATYCYTDIARTYRIENDLDALEKVSQRMKDEGKGDAASLEETLNSIRVARLDARFQRAGQLLEQAETAKKEADEKKARDLYSKAALELERVVDENPDYNKADIAMIEAARAFEEVQLYDKAAGLYKRLVEEKRFSKSEHRESAMKALAANYEKFFNFSAAVATHLRLVEEYSRGVNAKLSLIKAAGILENEQRYQEAAEVVARYARLYPNDENIVKLRYSIATLYENANSRSLAIDAYDDFIRKYRRDAKQVTRVMTSYIKLGRWALDDGDVKKAQGYFREVRDLYKRSGAKPKTKAAALVAEASFRLAESRFSEYASISIAGSSRQQRKAGLDKKKKLEELIQQYETITDFGIPEWVVAAQYREGMLWKDLAVSFGDAPYPSDLPQDKEYIMQYKIQISDLRAQFEDQAREIWRFAMEVARKTGINNEWTYKTLVELNKYGAERQRFPLYRDLKKFEAGTPLLNFPLGE